MHPSAPQARSVGTRADRGTLVFDLNYFPSSRNDYFEAQSVALNGAVPPPAIEPRLIGVNDVVKMASDRLERPFP